MIYAPPAEPYLTIAYEAEDYILLEKQSGILSVPGRGPEKADCLYSRLLKRNPEALVVHRLDLETSGLVIFARNKETQSYFGRLFQNRAVEKTYHAIVVGRISGASGWIDLPISADWINRPKQKIDYKNGKASKTYWELVKSNNNYSYIQLKPHTGRSHQLRVHMSSVGHPIAGDPLYNQKNDPTHFPRLFLHASELKFEDPQTHEMVKFASEVPFKSFL
ncbi:RluA family pseudouridine synthase [Sneathiella glossodoripedis]|uniref:RluA family pseudouridine synthase n=1 Tax=Sneathiella glossodoripedis TaxID=418853 RepID=UPI00047159CC|nr:RluA family pseudouridine synthase [Sneathiella glossodoripedis]